MSVLKNNKKEEYKNKKGQMALFVIIAIIIVSAISLYFILSTSVDEKSKIDPVFEPVYESFLTCAREDLETGISILESKGGYIENPDFESGSRHMPFSSQLNFHGKGVPYWYYVSGNAMEKEQVPSQEEVEKQLENYVEEEISNCWFGDFYEEGYEIDIGDDIRTRVSLKDDKVEMEMNNEMSLSKGNKTERITNHKVEVNSKLKALYEDAVKLYQRLKNTQTLEKYGRDVILSYAPVSGFEISCSPEIWKTDEVFDELEEGIEANTISLKSTNNDYRRTQKNKYFEIETPGDSKARFLNSREWPHTFEVNPSEGGALIAEPVGNQEGLGVLGFCFVSYDFKYDLKYPTMVQVYSSESDGGEETFQFPYAVVLEGNTPGMGKNGSATSTESIGVCEHKNTEMEVNTYKAEGTSLVPIESQISFKYMGESCDIGSTKESSDTGKLVEQFPQAMNGTIIAEAEGYEKKKKLVSTINPGEVNILLDRLYEKDVLLELDGREFSGREGHAVISFYSNDSEGVKTISYPEQKTVELSEGQYKIRARIYKNSSLSLQGEKSEKCVEVPSSGIGGLFGVTDEKCYDVSMPDQENTIALAGGGEQNHYIAEEKLEENERIKINAETLPEPDSLEQIQENNILIENQGLRIKFE